MLSTHAENTGVEKISEGTKNWINAGCITINVVLFVLNNIFFTSAKWGKIFCFLIRKLQDVLMTAFIVETFSPRGRHKAPNEPLPTHLWWTPNHYTLGKSNHSIRLTHQTSHWLIFCPQWHERCHLIRLNEILYIENLLSYNQVYVIEILDFTFLPIQHLGLYKVTETGFIQRRD